MNAAVAACAASDLEVDWRSINWAECHRQVRRLQARIVKAVQEGRWGKVKALQWLLTHSFSGKAIAVKRVTENQGKKTPGSGRGNLVKPGNQVSGHIFAQKAWLYTAPTETGIYPEKQRQDATARNTDHERPGDAGTPPTGLGTCPGNHSG